MNYTSTSYKLTKHAKLVVRTVVDRKEGRLHTPDAEMINATISKYRAMQKALATGTDIEEDAQWSEPDVIECDDYRVQIFGDVEIALPTGDYRAEVAMFNEYTDPRETVDLMREMFRGLWLAGAIEANGNGNGSAPPPRQDNSPEDLDEWFPRDSDNDDSALPPASANTGNADMAHIALFDYKQQDAYEAKYTGQTVTVDVSRISNVYDVKNDGTGAYQIFKFFPFYEAHGKDVMSSSYPAHALNTFPPRNKDQWSWGGYRELRDLVPEAGDSVSGHFVCKYKLNRAKDGRVFWNLQGIDPVGDYEGAGPSYGGGDVDFADASEGESKDEIPF